MVVSPVSSSLSSHPSFLFFPFSDREKESPFLFLLPPPFFPRWGSGTCREGKRNLPVCLVYQERGRERGSADFLPVAALSVSLLPSILLSSLSATD